MGGDALDAVFLAHDSLVAVNGGAEGGFGDGQFIDDHVAILEPAGHGGCAARGILLITGGGDEQVVGERFVGVVLQQVQADGQRGFGVDGTSTINAVVFDSAVEGITLHLLDANGVHVDIDAKPFVGLAVKETKDIVSAGEDFLMVNLRAQRLELLRDPLGHFGLAGRAGARAGLGGGDAGDADHFREQMSDFFTLGHGLEAIARPCAGQWDIGRKELGVGGAINIMSGVIF